MSRIAIACALCLLLAGCAAPTAPARTTVSGTTEGADGTNRSAVTDDDIAVRGGSLPFDHDRVFARTTRLLGEDVAPPAVIVVRSPAEIRRATGGVVSSGGGSGTRTFSGVLGIGRDGDDGGGNDGGGDGDEGVSVAAYAPSARTVVVNERLTTLDRTAALERTLAHEFVHSVQFRRDAFRRLEAALDVERDYTRDTYLTYVSLVEGTASYVAGAYDRRYLAGDWASVTTTERYRESPPRVKYAVARYYFGSRYVASRFDSPANVSAVYDDPPTTTEQLLHNDSDGSELPRPLALTVAPGENRTRVEDDTNGELFTRIALGTELNESRAADAAAGWGADRLAAVEPRDRTGGRSFVWATRWDSRAEAGEFETALTAYLDSRADGTGASGVRRDGSLAFRTVRVSAETVVLLAGEGSFVRGASVSGTNASATVSA